MTEREMVGTAVKALDSKKGKDIRVLYTADQTTLADYFIICNGTSNTQVKALADAVEGGHEPAGRGAPSCGGAIRGAVDAAGLLQRSHPRVYRGGSGVLLPGAAVVGCRAGGRVPVSHSGLSKAGRREILFL